MGWAGAEFIISPFKIVCRVQGNLTMRKEVKIFALKKHAQKCNRDQNER